MAADHTAAVLAALRTNPNLTVFEGPVPKGTAPPYVAVYVYYPNESREKMPPVTNRTDVIAITHSVASSQEGTRIVRNNVRTSLLDQRMSVTGALCSPITHEVGNPPDWDTSSGVTVMSAVDEWDYTARPA